MREALFAPNRHFAKNNDVVAKSNITSRAAFFYTGIYWYFIIFIDIPAAKKRMKSRKI